MRLALRLRLLGREHEPEARRVEALATDEDEAAGPSAQLIWIVRDRPVDDNCDVGDIVGAQVSRRLGFCAVRIDTVLDRLYARRRRSRRELEIRFITHFQGAL